MLEESGVPFTSLCNGFYVGTPTYYLSSVPRTATIAVPKDGPVAWTTQADLADAAACTLADEGRFDGPTPLLTAGQALTFDDVAATLTDLTGRPVTREVAEDEEFVSAMVSGGMPEPAARLFALGMSSPPALATSLPSTANSSGSSAASSARVLEETMSTCRAPSNGPAGCRDPAPVSDPRTVGPNPDGPSCCEECGSDPPSGRAQSSCSGGRTGFCSGDI